MAWTGKESHTSAVIQPVATAWGTGTTCTQGLQVEEQIIPAGEPQLEIVKTTDIAFPSMVFMGGVDPIETEVELPYRYCSSTSVSVWDQILMSVFYGKSGTATTVTTVDTNGRRHTGTIASSHAFQNTIDRRFTITERNAKSTGYAYRCIPSWQPTGLELTSKEGKDPLKIKVKGIGNQVAFDSATSTGSTYGTYLDQERMAHHSNLSIDTAAGGCWMVAGAARTASSPVSFTVANKVHPSELKIRLDRKMKGYHTDGVYTDAPIDDDFGELKVTYSQPQILDANWDTDGFIDALKDWETNGTGKYFHLRARWSFPTIITGAASTRPYLEIGLPELMPTKIEGLQAKAGKPMPLTVEFQALQPTSATYLPNEFKYCGGTAGAAHDVAYMAIMNQSTAAIIAAA